MSRGTRETEADRKRELETRRDVKRQKQTQGWRRNVVGMSVRKIAHKKILGLYFWPSLVIPETHLPLFGNKD